MQVHLMHAYLLMVRQEGIAMDFSLRETSPRESVRGGCPGVTSTSSI